MKKLYAVFLLLTISSASIAQSLSTSNLPIIIINTIADSIVDEPKIMVEMGIIENAIGLNNVNDPLNHFDGYCGIEFRGHSSQSFDKKNYSLELWNQLGEDSAVSLLGMGKEEDWILHASHMDRTFMRNPLFYRIWREMGHWASNVRYVELIIDGDYRGVYHLMEKIKRDDDRLDIAKLDSNDNAGDSLTGGYIIRMDWPGGQGWYSSYNAMAGTPLFFQYYYPKEEKITTQQGNYIAGYIEEFEEALFSSNYTNLQGKRYQEYIDITTFADLFIVNELSRSVDGYKASSFIHKDKYSKGGLLKAGSIWDFDLSSGNADYCDGTATSGWTYLQTAFECDDLDLMPMWWDAFMADTIFTNHLRCRWESHRLNMLHSDTLSDYIALMVDSVDDGQTRNFQRWDILNTPLWAEPSLPGTYAGEVQMMEDWFTARITWLDANIPGNCSNDFITIEEKKKLRILVYPNPVSTTLFVDLATAKFGQIAIYNFCGAQVYAKDFDGAVQLNMASLSPGVYLIEIVSEGISHHEKLIIR